jgi:hypothetical protein
MSNYIMLDQISRGNISFVQLVSGSNSLGHIKSY